MWLGDRSTIQEMGSRPAGAGAEHPGAARVRRPGDEVRQAQLRSSGRVKRRDKEDIGGRMLGMEIPGRMKGNDQRERFLDVVKEDMQLVTVVTLRGRS